jgi:hypothetical protein
MQFIEIPTEQTTAATDLLLFIVLTIMAGILYKEGKNKDHIKTNIWVAVFMLVAIAALLGAIAHGFKMGYRIHFILWQPLNLFLGISVGLFGAGVIYDWKRSLFNRKLVIILISAGILFYLASLLIPGGFMVFIIFEAVFMVFALIIYFRLFTKGQLAGTGLMTLGILITIIAAIFQTLHSIRIHLIWAFDHNGIFHLTQLLGFFFLFFGLKRFFNLSKAISQAN